MYTIRLQLDLNPSEERFLSKCFFFGNKIRNSIASVAQRRLNCLFHDHNYLSARKEYGKSDFGKKKGKELSPSQKKRKKQLSIIMQSKLVEYKLRKTDLESYISTMQKHYSTYITSHQAQAEVNAVYKGVEKVLYGDGDHLHFRRYNDYDCIKQKNSTNGVKISDWNHCIFMKKDFNIKPAADTPYMNEVMNSTFLSTDVIYTFLKRIEFNSGFKYYIVITLRGEAPKKVKLSDKRSRTGVDFGTSTIATVSSSEVNLVELAPLSAKYEKEIRHLQKLVNNSMRVHNPDNYNKNGTIKKGRHKWKLTHKCKKLKRRIRVLYRKQSAYIAASHNTFLNHLITTVSEFIVEPMNFSGLQKRSKNTERSDKVSTVKNKDGTAKKVHKFKRKKRYGHSIKNRSPGLMQETLKKKAVQYDIPYFEIDRNNYRASQLHHDTGEYIKSSVDERTKMIDGHEVQRDLYSAFLISNTDDSLRQPDFKACNTNFNRFVELHDVKIQDMKVNGISFKQCFGF